MRGRRRQLLHRWVWPWPRLVVDLLAAAFVAWEGVQGRYSAASHASILAVIGAVLLLALVSGRGRQRKAARTWVRDAARALRAAFAAGRLRTAAVGGTLVWVLLIAATIGWDATSFIKQRHDLPTLSRLFGDVTDHDWGRALVFAAWLVLGLYLATGWRRTVGEPAPDLQHTSGAARRTGPPPRRSTPSPSDEGGVA